MKRFSRPLVLATALLLMAVPLLPVSSASTPLPGQSGCTTSLSANPRPAAWFSLGKPATYFDDGCFHQFMVNKPDTASIDVLIVPPTGATSLRDANLLRESVQMWEAGLKQGAHTSGMDWLRDGIRITPFVVGEDIPAGVSAAVPDIVVVLGDVGPIGLAWAFAGVGMDGPVTFCHPVADIAAGNYPSREQIRAQPGFDDHHGVGWGTLETACANGSRTCVVAGTVAYDLPTDPQAVNLYDLMSHEFGHCLGLGHVGDASDFASLAYPPDDIMSYEQDGHDPGYMLCVSNLDLKTFAYRYQPLIAGAGSLGYSADSAGYVVMQGGSNPIDSGMTGVLTPIPASSWRIFKSDGSESTVASDCPQPDLALVQLPPLAAAAAPEPGAGAQPATAAPIAPAGGQPTVPSILVAGLALAGLGAFLVGRRPRA